MYSKANSEAEYVDPETLWDRLNDAIDTIIRKDETMETGEFLPPCVEAALNLGCVPVRSSRSQRNSNTRSYLNPRTQDSGQNARNLNAPNVQRPDTEANKDIRPNSNFTPPGSSFYPPSFENFPRNMGPFENKNSSIYPLYHGFHLQPRAPQMGFHNTHQNPGSIIVGTPVFRAARAACEPLPSSNPERLFSFDRGDENESKKESRPELGECDLSLRLGPVSSSGKGLTSFENVDSGPSDKGFKNKEFSFFPLNSEVEEGQNLGTDVRKRKMVGESGSFLEFDPDFYERMKKRGL